MADIQTDFPDTLKKLAENRKHLKGINKMTSIITKEEMEKINKEESSKIPFVDGVWYFDKHTENVKDLNKGG